MYCQKAIVVIGIELSLLEKHFCHPERFIKEQTLKSNLYVIPRSKDLGIVALVEIAESLFLSKGILNSEGKPASRKQIANIFELMFNVSFGDIYKKADEIYRRKPFNLTKALDALKFLLSKESRRRDEL
ncbi:hypothetical protein E2605_09670 [Dysgonomonas capnocytophagoides]|uniref:RteC protein n=1 Tax=Dysgonomonas capnocytophagoides TaxID=45254 RepID=A0A4Y8L2P1_9BACT|nr:hypothetical protein E2605_09670 [Dysgonomonas capnocytophagoides]